MDEPVDLCKVLIYFVTFVFFVDKKGFYGNV